MCSHIPISSTPCSKTPCKKFCKSTMSRMPSCVLSKNILPKEAPLSVERRGKYQIKKKKRKRDKNQISSQISSNRDKHEYLPVWWKLKKLSQNDSLK